MATVSSSGSPPRAGAPLALLVALTVAACGGGGAEEQTGDARSSSVGTDTVMKVEPGSAMDTTPAGTPAPPSPATVADTL